MPRPNPRAPKLGQTSLFAAEVIPEAEPGKILRGRHSETVDAALSAALEADIIDTIDGALATTIRAGAWALDAGEASNRPYLPSKTVPAMVEAIRELGLTPEARKADTNDAVSELVRQLAEVDPEDSDVGA